MAYHWRKLGHLFNPEQHQLPAGCELYAQSPQALVLDDRVRVYFSTRRAEGGKFVSHVTFAEFSKDFSALLGVADHAVLPPSGLGCFDEHGIFPLSPLVHGDRVLAYTTGWNRRRSVSVDTAIGLAISHDGGQHFERVGAGPVLTASLHEPFLVGDAFVRHFQGRFYLWYIYGTGWKRQSDDAAPDRIYKIAQTVSDDGIHWQGSGGVPIIADVIGPDECQALPSVLCVDGRYHMMFCYRHVFNFRQDPSRGYRLGHAWSDDLLVWHRDDADFALAGTPGDWDADMQCYPHVFSCDGQVYLLYNGNQFGRHGFGLAQLQKV